ncbi:MAG: MATE family efflux transporter [Clostridia bacterium]|nr:MATE family efflux transporter [Clostridia bacterium]MBR5379512.1 MATE family efflux transporter [Clostridia bacterium]MBR5750938.1 MATE family efflux transporter [Clostridia bacterium]
MNKQRSSSRYEMDMTSGPLLTKILSFSGPLVLMGMLQLLYNAADIVVVGRFASSQSQAAVGSTGSLINLLVNVFMGLSVGASVLVARCYGAGDVAKVQKAVHTAVTLALFSGLTVGLFGFVMAKRLLRLMDSPEDVIDLASTYIRIYFAGMPVNMLYNFGAAVLRAVGDTRRPMYYLSLSGLVNVLLNLLLVIVFRMDVAGVAIATVASQLISAFLVIRCLMKSSTCVHLDIRRLGVDRECMKSILRIGLPAGLQGSVFSISNVLIQTSVNSFGSMAMAGNTNAGNLEGFVYTAMNAIHQADITFASQNYGARRYGRVRKVLWCCLGAATAIGLTMGLLFIVFDRQLLSIYNASEDVIFYGLKRMLILMPTYFLCGLMDVMVGQLRGIGYSVMPMIVSLTGACALRLIWIWTLFSIPAYHTLEVLYLSYPVSWAVTFAAHMVCYLICSRKRLPRTDS